MGVLGQSPLPKTDPHEFWTPHDGDCGLWSGQVSGFVRMLRIHHTMGVVAQSPLSEKIRTILEAAKIRFRTISRYEKERSERSPRDTQNPHNPGQQKIYAPATGERHGPERSHR